MNDATYACHKFGSNRRQSDSIGTQYLATIGAGYQVEQSDSPHNARKGRDRTCDVACREHISARMSEMSASKPPFHSRMLTHQLSSPQPRLLLLRDRIRYLLRSELSPSYCNPGTGYTDTRTTNGFIEVICQEIFETGSPEQV